MLVKKDRTALQQSIKAKASKVIKKVPKVLALITRASIRKMSRTALKKTLQKSSLTVFDMSCKLRRS